jgi:DNA-binding MarR family transcriptional regulator
MSEVKRRPHLIDAVVDEIVALSDAGDHDVPEWAGRELTFGQMRLVFLLGKHAAVPMSRIAEWLGVGLPAATGYVERVERHGLVERRHRTDDRRVVECALTGAGRELIEQITGFQRHSIRETLGVLNEAELAELGRLVSLVALRRTGGADSFENT